LYVWCYLEPNFNPDILGSSFISDEVLTLLTLFFLATTEKSRGADENFVKKCPQLQKLLRSTASVYCHSM